MKELDNIQSDKLQVAEVRPDTTMKLKKKGFMHPGHKMYRLDRQTGKITEVELSSPDYNMQTGGTSRKVNVEGDQFMYECALNRKNVEKKFKRRLTNEMIILTIMQDDV